MDIQLLREILEAKVAKLIRQGVDPYSAADASVREILSAVDAEMSPLGCFQMRAALAGAWREIQAGH